MLYPSRPGPWRWESGTIAACGACESSDGGGETSPVRIIGDGEGNNWGRLFPLSVPGLLQVTLHGNIRPARF